MYWGTCAFAAALHDVASADFFLFLHRAIFRITKTEWFIHMMNEDFARRISTCPEWSV
jgi:hypothetical protein